MLSLVALAVATSVSPSAPASVGPAVQARATVQIIQTNGESQPARLIEFQ
jgi:hypothetical protein